MSTKIQNYGQTTKIIHLKNNNHLKLFPYLCEEPSKEVLKYFVDKQLPLNFYNSLSFGFVKPVSYDNGGFGFLKIGLSEITKPNEVLKLDLINNFDSSILEDEVNYYDEGFISRLVKNNLFNYVPESRFVAAKGGKEHLKIDYENKNIPYILDLAQIIMGDNNFSKKDLFNLIPKNLPKTKTIKGYEPKNSGQGSMFPKGIKYKRVK